MHPLPVKLENVEEYVKRHEAQMVKGRNVPSDPSRRWFKKDLLTECVDRCRFELFSTAMEESGGGAFLNAPTQRLVHSRYASLQSDCDKACIMSSITHLTRSTRLPR